MLRISSCISILMLLLSLPGKAQFGIEWIDFTQRYFKLKVVDDDFYRVTSAELAAAGFPVSTVPASRIQLFRRGEEVAIAVVANGDGTLNYLEFYGQRNDGSTDSPLYDVGDQPHTFYNLFTDTATYFLTYKLGSENGKRMVFSSDQDATGLTAEPYHLEESIDLETSTYGRGLQFSSTFTLSKYDEAEGWTGPYVGKGGSTDHSFVLQNRVTGTDPSCDFVLIGGNSLAHNAQTSAGPDAGSLTTLGSTVFNGWGSTLDGFTISESNIGAGGELTIRVFREGFPDEADFISVAYMRVTYPQTISVGASENKVFTLGTPAAAKAYLRISTTNAAGTSVYDINDPINPIRIATTNFSDRVEAVIPNFVSDHKIMAAANPAAVESIEEVTLTEPDLTGKNYLIITDERLRVSGDPINDYKIYRESTAGGSYNVSIDEIDDIYDLFNYGDPSPLGIWNYIRYAVSEGSPEYVFIIGKGFTPNTNYYRGTQTTVNVPTYGLPGSDLMYTLGINTDPNLPGIPIGRLNAFTTADVTAYLNKIIEMEALPFDQLWRKDFLQLSGGFSAGEPEQFASYIQNFTDVLEVDFIGGRAFNTAKKTSEAVEFIDVADRINQGVGYVTFFGHSSGTATDIEIGIVSDPEFGFMNRGKYPVFLVNGCKAGEIFGSGSTFGEDWMSTPELGAVAFMAHADFAIASTLRNWSNLYYDIAYANDVFIGQSIGNVVVEVSSRYLSNFGSGVTSLTQIQQMLLQGDPAYRVFGADHPDYHIDENSLYAEAIIGQQVLANQDSFKLNMIVKNFGRTVSDSLIVQVDRIFPDGNMISYVERFERPLRLDTLVMYLPNDLSNENTGQNVLNVNLDPINTVTELSESNNTSSLELLIFSGNTSHLIPVDNGVTSNQQVEMVWQSSNPLESERGYALEIDTSPDFDSSNKRSFTVNGELIMRHTFDFSQWSLADSSTVFWRTRYADPGPDESNDWVTTSFSIVGGVPNGWGQYTNDQVNDATVTGVEYNAGSNRWEFIQSVTPIDIFTFGVDNPLVYDDIQAIVGGLDFMVTSEPIDPFCRTNTLNAIAFDKESGDPYKPYDSGLVGVFDPEVCGRLPQRIYNFTENDLLVDGDLQTVIDNMRDGDQIVLFNIGDITYSNWNATFETTLNSIGISSATIAALIDGQPIICLGRKGDAPGSATVLVDNGGGSPVREQSLRLQDNVMGSFTSGTIRTKEVGPARNWIDYAFNITEDANDNYSLNIYGVDIDGNSSLIPEFERSRAETIDVSSIDETVYPELELEFTFDDETDLTPPQLNFWQLSYDLPPEGLVFPASKSGSTFQEGENVSVDLFFYNLSNLDFTDSLDVNLRMINQNSASTQTGSMRIGPPTTNDTTAFTASFPSIGFSGANSLVVEVIPNENEMYDFNNRLTLANQIEVIPDETNPVLDVTFDGAHILDGDIVSPTPNIAIRMRDQNQFLIKDDTTGVNISLRLPGEASIFQRVNFSDPTLEFTPATESQDFEVTYAPGPLDDGVYGLRIQAEDESGNQAGTEPYEINFEVINESSVTHFYPYPNPFSTSCRFVFTLTGSVIPDQIKIQILTVSGRVVREITQDEIGTIRIGNNITEYAWDGGDEFGDVLANGVYFYKVFINSNGQSLDRRATSADRAFKNGFGKLYILR